MLTTKGRVSSGRALASQHLVWHTAQLSKLLGANPQSGSLNITLPRPLKLSAKNGVRLGQGKHRMVWNAYLNERNVLLYRWQGCPLSVVEIISDVHLRSELNLVDDALVELKICRDNVEKIRSREWLGWVLLWQWRTQLYYKSDYEKWIVSVQHYFDGRIGGVALIKKIVGKIFGFWGSWLRRLFLRSEVRGNDGFVRKTPRGGNEGKLDRLLNLLTYTKTSGSAYAAQQYPAGYHTLVLGDRILAGQRLPSARLNLLPISLEGLTVLDVGCNQGGMLFEAAGRGIRWGVGIDYDSRMVNAANKVKQYREVENLDFFVFNLEKEKLPLIQDFLPCERVDIVFLLSVCMWIDNWRDVIAFCSNLAPYMLFESNGSDEQQDAQVECLRENFDTVNVLQLTSEDDEGQKKRKLYFCAYLAN